MDTRDYTSEQSELKYRLVAIWAAHNKAIFAASTIPDATDREFMLAYILDATSDILFRLFIEQEG